MMQRMEANVCDVNHLEADVLLPPRKRLLAGFKKQNSDVDANAVDAASATAASASASALQPPIVASSSSASPSTPPPPSFPIPPPPQTPPSPFPCSPASDEFQTRLNNLLSSYFNNEHNVSQARIMEASKSAANVAADAAKAARISAQEKAVAAARAVASAKSALAMVAAYPEESGVKDRILRKNKLKKHVQVQLLYEKHKPIEKYRDDEEFARKLHRVMNSSPRISKGSPRSESKGPKNKKLKSLLSSERTKNSDGSVLFEDNSPANSSSEDTLPDIYTTGYGKTIQSHSDDDGESSCPKERISGHHSTPGKKRGRLKLKKLPLSLCNYKDSAKEDTISGSTSLTEKNVGNPKTYNKPLFPAESSADSVRMSVEATRMWKCQEFKAPACVKQNKVVQS